MLLNGKVKRRTEVVGIFPNDDALVRLVGTILLEQNDEWAIQCISLETMAALSDDPASDFLQRSSDQPAPRPGNCPGPPRATPRRWALSENPKIRGLRFSGSS
jgi:hypothetical protein